jgi:hypothetical protein
MRNNCNQRDNPVLSYQLVFVLNYFVALAISASAAFSEC